MNVSAISVYVTDLGAATRFYTDTLGFRVEKSLGEYGVKLESAGFSLLLCAGGEHPRPAYPSGVVLGLRTTSLERDVEALRSCNVRLVHDQPQPFPAGRYVAFVDPFGIAHELLEYGTTDP